MLYDIASSLENRKNVDQLYVIKVKNRNKVREKLFERGIATGIHYSAAIHLQPAYDFLRYKKGDLPVAEETVNRILSLPMFPELTEEQIKYIRSSLIEILG